MAAYGIRFPTNSMTREPVMFQALRRCPGGSLPDSGPKAAAVLLRPESRAAVGARRLPALAGRCTAGATERNIGKTWELSKIPCAPWCS